VSGVTLIGYSDPWENHTTDLVKDVAFIDDVLGPFDCITNPNSRWNGWAMPWFSLEVVRKIKEAIEEDSRLAEADYHVLTIEDGEVPAVWLWCESYKEEYEDKRGDRYDPLLTDGGPFYGIGAGSWTWNLQSDRGGSA
jgi:hypothetical protein